MVQYFAFIHVVIIQVAFLTVSNAGIKCPGYCTKDLAKCRGKGGKIIGYCTNALACCDPVVAVTGSCTDTKHAQKVVFFKSADFPEFSQGDLNCEFNVQIMEDAVGIRVEFLKAEMDGMSFLRSEADGGNCESDMIFFRGFGTWAPPPLCGNLTGYISLIDKFSGVSKNLKTLTIVALMSSLNYRWNIKITQISKYTMYSKDESVNVKEPAVIDYEDVSIMEEDKPILYKPLSKPTIYKPLDKPILYLPLYKPYRYRRSENSNTTDESAASSEIIPDSTDKNDDTAENISYLTTTTVKTMTTPETLLATPAKLSWIPDSNKSDEDHTEHTNINSFKPNKEYEKPEHRFEIPLIVNGQDTEIIEVPWQASIRIKANYPKLKAKPIDEPDVEANEIDSSKTQLNYNSLNASEFDVSLNDTKTAQDNCSESEGYHFCGGALVSNNIVMSAAHCFFGNSKTEGMTDIESIEVVLGDTNLCTDERKQEILPSYHYDVESILIHYAYDPHLLINDIAVLKLKKNVTLADNVRPVKLADAGANFTYKEALVSGWGDTNLTNSDDETSPSILQSSMKFRVQNRTFCNDRDLEQYTDTRDAILKHPKYQYVFESTICTLGTKDNKTFEISSGKGDSGGGLIVFDKFGEPILAGIVSYGVLAPENDEKDTKNVNIKNKVKGDIMSNPTDPDQEDDTRTKTLDYFTSVSFYRKWIELAMII